MSSLCCHGAPRPRPGGLGGAEARRPPRDFGEGHRPRRGWRPPSVHAHGLSRKLDELTHGLRPHTHVHTHTRRAHTHVHTNKHTHARMCTLMYTHTCAHAHTHEHTNARVRAHVRTHIRTHRAKRLPCGTSRSCPHASRVGTTGAARPVLPTPPLRGGPARRSRDGGHAQAAEPLSGDKHAGHGCNAQLGDPHFTSRDTVPSLETWPLRQEHRGGGGLGDDRPGRERDPDRAGRRDLPVSARPGSVSEDGAGRRTQGDGWGTLQKHWNKGSTVRLCLQ